MFSYWLASRARVPSALAGATASVVLHGLLLSGAVMATMPRRDVPPDSAWNRAAYLPPPDKTPPGHGTADLPEHVSYLALMPPAPVGLGTEPPKPKPVDEPKKIVVADSQPVLVEAAPPESKQDSVFTELEVDTPVRITSSAAPDYPADLLKQNVEGKVIARWVIDTTGRADTASFELLQATRPEFAAAVRAVLARMKFEPARIGKTPVRQLVEQSIAFKIQTPTPVPAKVTGPQKPAPPNS